MSRGAVPAARVRLDVPALFRHRRDPGISDTIGLPRVASDGPAVFVFDTDTLAAFERSRGE